MSKIISTHSFRGGTGKSNVTANLALTFLAGLPGPQNVYMLTYEKSGLNTGWQQMGTWTTSSVSSQPPIRRTKATDP